MNKLGFKMKVLPMLGTALVALLFMAITTLLQERSLIIESRREQLATAVQSAHSIVAAFQAKAASGAMSQEDAQKAAKDALVWGQCIGTGQSFARDLGNQPANIAYPG